MARPTRPPPGKCPHGDDSDQCVMQCKFNHFESEELTIYAWELKCLDCGWRDTVGFRSDEEEDEEDSSDANPAQCPFCAKCDLPTGTNPCDKA